MANRRPARLSVQNAITKMELSVKLIKERCRSDGNPGKAEEIAGIYYHSLTKGAFEMNGNN